MECCVPEYFPPMAERVMPRQNRCGSHPFFISPNQRAPDEPPPKPPLDPPKPPPENDPPDPPKPLPPLLDGAAALMVLRTEANPASSCVPMSNAPDCRPPKPPPNDGSDDMPPPQCIGL